MIKLFLLLSVLMITDVFAQDTLTVSIEPKRPIVNETFNVVFKLNSQDAESIDEINLKHPGLTIEGKSQQGISTRTVYANGKLTVSREISVVYEMMASNYGVKFLRDIKVKVGNKEISHPLVSFEVLKEPRVKPDVFAMADVAKTDLYLGEGFIVRYYLYSKVSVNNLDIKTYPKLNKFLKRYLQEPDRSERVEVDGEIYIRNLIYAAKLFPEKTGILKVDPITLSVTYARRNGNDPFNVFLNSRDLKTRSVSSETINLNVLPWPTPVPKDFTGLVGPHEFSLELKQQKIVVNQLLEAELRVRGPGALENYEAPPLIENPALEEFESNGELKIEDANMASKNFNYAFLASAPIELPEDSFSFSYLDPTKAQYVSVKVKRDAIKVGGQGRVTPQVENKQSVDAPSNISASSLGNDLVPLAQKFNWNSLQAYLNLSLGALVIVALIGVGVGQLRGHKTGRSIVPASFKKEFNPKDFIHWLSPVISHETKSAKDVLASLELSPGAYQYFLELMNSSDVSKFSLNKKSYNYVFNAKYFKEIASKIEKYNESDSKHS